MTHLEAVQYAMQHEPDLKVPALLRPKSWLLIFIDPDRRLHYYDCKDGPMKAYTRLMQVETVRGCKLAKIMQFSTPTGAAELKTNILQVDRLVQHMLDEFDGKVPATDGNEPY